MYTIIRRSVCFLLIGASVIFGGCAEEVSPQTEFILGTVCTVNLYTKGSGRLYRQIFDRLREIEARMSVNLSGTEIEKINEEAGKNPVKVHRDLIDVIESALYFSQISDGAFDPTIGPLVKLWGIGLDNSSGNSGIPRRDEIDAVLPLINWRDVVIDKTAGTVFLRRSGMRLDLGAIAKGYAADEAARILRSARVPRAIIDLGGNVFAFGVKENKLPWTVGIQNPSGERGSYIGYVEVYDKTLVTSGVYERFIEVDGKRYHHIFNVKDGYPVENGLVSVTIIAGRSIDADSLSTGVFALGYEKGKALVETLDDVEALFVFEDRAVRGTRGALEAFTVTDTSYRLVP